jgi:SAM-dependent methyltransferase
MAHKEQIQYCSKIRSKYPEYFKDCEVLDIGSLDINGNNRYLFKNYTYIGLDIGAGRNVNVVSRGHLYSPDFKFDFVISTECFEHDEFYKKTLLNAYKLLKPGGFMLFTCATTGRPEHGTTRTRPKDAPYVGDYYKNLTESDIKEVWDCDILFSNYEFEVNNRSKDLYFYGIKKEV